MIVKPFSDYFYTISAKNREIRRQRLAALIAELRRVTERSSDDPWGHNILQMTQRNLHLSERLASMAAINGRANVYPSRFLEGAQLILSDSKPIEFKIENFEFKLPELNVARLYWTKSLYAKAPFQIAMFNAI